MKLPPVELMIEIQGDREDERSRQSRTHSSLWEEKEKKSQKTSFTAILDHFQRHLEVWRRFFSRVCTKSLKAVGNRLHQLFPSRARVSKSRPVGQTCPTTSFFEASRASLLCLRHCSFVDKGE